MRKLSKRPNPRKLSGLVRSDLSNKRIKSENSDSEQQKGTAIQEEGQASGDNKNIISLVEAKGICDDAIEHNTEVSATVDAVTDCGIITEESAENQAQPLPSRAAENLKIPVKPLISYADSSEDEPDNTEFHFSETNTSPSEKSEELNHPPKSSPLVEVNTQNVFLSSQLLEHPRLGEDFGIEESKPFPMSVSAQDAGKKGHHQGTTPKPVPQPVPPPPSQYLPEGAEQQAVQVVRPHGYNTRSQGVTVMEMQGEIHKFYNKPRHIGRPSIKQSFCPFSYFFS